MSNRRSSGALIIGVVLLAAGAFYWIHERSSRLEALASSSRRPKAEGERPPISRGDVKSGSTSLPANATKKPLPDSDGPRVGEVLEYAADVSKLSNVANLKLQLTDKRNFMGKNALHLQAFAHTENPLRMVVELDDQFDSYSDAGNLSSLQYEMHLNEGGQKVDSVQRMTSTGQEPTPANVTNTRIVPGTRDPLGLMQYLRGVDWAKTPEVHSPVYDGHKLYEVRASLGKKAEEVNVPAGKFTASKIDIHVFEGGVEKTDATFALYLANDSEHKPVLLEAQLPFATARVQLAKVQ